MGLPIWMTVFLVGYCVRVAAQSDASGVSIGLDSARWGGGARLVITVSPQDARGNILPPQKLLLDTGSSTLAFCDSSFANQLMSLQTQYYSCNIYGGDGSETTGYWGAFYQGTVQLYHSDVNATLTNAYFSVMQQDSMKLREDGFDGIFGIASRLLNEATSQKPSAWPRSHVGSCPQPDLDLDDPLMQYLGALGGNKQMGIYWSGKVGDGEGRLYLGNAAMSNPHFDTAASSRIGSAKMNMQGNYNINVLGMEYDGRTYDVNCGARWPGTCSLDTGAPAIIVPLSVYAAIMKSAAGDLVVTLEGADNTSVQLRFDVQTLINNNWLDHSTETILGLPFRAFYYSVMDLTASALYFSPMPDYFMQVSSKSMIV